MSIELCGVCPHPPIAVPYVGQMESDKVKETQYAMVELGGRIKDARVDTVVIISPHAPVFQDVVGINMKPVLKGDLSKFGAGYLKYELENDLPLAAEIKNQAAGLGLQVLELNEDVERRYGLDLNLDHGVTVPLYFLEEGGAIKPLVHVAMSVASPEQLYLFGLAVRQASDVLGRKVALVASADLSHCLAKDAPGGYNKRGEEFDLEMKRLLEAADIEGIIGMDPTLVREAGECGYRSIVMMLGALDGFSIKSDVLTYEGPFGVGYLVAILDIVSENPQNSLLAKLQEKKLADLEERRSQESYLVGLARKTLENHLSKAPQPQTGDIPEEFKKRAGVFVSIKKQGSLRGCIGTIEPCQASVVEEVMANAISAGMQDPRFQPVRSNELDELVYSVDVLQPPEPIGGLGELDPAKYGVIVRSGHRSGLLLPNLEGIETPEEQVEIARQKAGISPTEEVQLERFEVVRYT
ncbi:MAG: AmmeMemoRadiSam system protein A [Desulfotomaculaceae bacterium]|nr:AmmeMemoRadiSam system protein A [Desulfotomaculaceae bacterium]